jgi:hypothetical protein
MLHYERNTDLGFTRDRPQYIAPKSAKADLGAADRSHPSLVERLHLRGLAA